MCRMAEGRWKTTAEKKGSVSAEASKKYSFEAIHAALFPDGPPKPKSLEELKEGIREYMRKAARGPLTLTSALVAPRIPAVQGDGW